MLFNTEYLKDQWLRFQSGKPVTGVALPVLQSWQRCKALRLPPAIRPAPSLTGAELDAMLEPFSQLIRQATPWLQTLAGQFPNSQLVLLSPAGHVLLEVAAGSANHIHARGQSMAEDDLGTHAANLCLATGAPIQTLGAEHYALDFHDLGNAAAPILAGDLLACLNICQPLASFSEFTAIICNTAAQAISDRMQLAETISRQNDMLDNLEDGLILLAPDCQIQQMNGRARQLCNPRKGSQTPRRIDEIVQSRDFLDAVTTGKTLREKELLLPGGPCLAALRPCGTGMLLKLREIRQQRPVTSLPNSPVCTFESILGESEALRNAVATARIAAQGDATTLILGESGTGKELFAQALHNAGGRANGPFIALNCGAMPSELVQSELFGYEEGAFTGAARQGKPGKFELADNGTIFLDEIGEMPLNAQVSLLRVLQSGEISRVGGKGSRAVNVRVIAATNRNLRAAVAQGLFREDLFYRLNVFTLELPPLRDRVDDIPLLARHFLDKFARDNNRPALEFAPELLRCLTQYSWPGNIRELENTVQRMGWLSQDTTLGPDLLPEHIRLPQSGHNAIEAKSASPHMARAAGDKLETERQDILQAIRDCRGNMKAVAEALGISRSGLYLKLNQFGIDAGAVRRESRKSIRGKQAP